MRTQEIILGGSYAPAMAIAGILTLGLAPAFAQQDRAQSKQEAGADLTVPASSLEGARVLDNQNREVGTISSLFIDPQTGQIERANIDLQRRLFGTNQQYSVAWEMLSVKRQDGELVATLDQSVMERVQRAGKPEEARGERKGIFGLRQRERDPGQRERQASDRSSSDELSADGIRRVQQKLNQEGFNAGEVSGEWSERTQTAVRNFQQSKGLEATGELDKRTLDELGLDTDEFREGSGSPGRGAVDRPGYGTKN